jgi:hypothetical protein
MHEDDTIKPQWHGNNYELTETLKHLRCGRRVRIHQNRDASNNVRIHNSTARRGSNNTINRSSQSCIVGQTNSIRMRIDWQEYCLCEGLEESEVEGLTIVGVVEGECGSGTGSLA